MTSEICKKKNIPEKYKGDPSLESLFACKQAVECYNEQVKHNKNVHDKNEIIKAEYDKDLASWNRWKNEEEKWVDKRGKYSKWVDILSSKDTTFNLGLNWYNCNDVITNNKNANWECMNEANKKGLYNSWGDGFYSYGRYRTNGTGPCSWWGAKCKRTESSKKKIDSDYQAARPTTDPENGKKWSDSTKPEFNEITYESADSTIQCCGNIVNAGDGNSFEDFKQSCSQEVNNKIDKLTNNKNDPDLLKDAYPEDSETEDSETEDSETEDSETDKVKKNEQVFLGLDLTTWGVIAGVIIMVLLLLSISSSLGLAVSGTKKIK